MKNFGIVKLKRIRNTVTRFAGWLLVLVSLSGCASAVDCYPCGQVSCQYCPPNPLPWSVPDTCTCHDSIGQMYLSHGTAATEPDNGPGPGNWTVTITGADNP